MPGPKTVVHFIEGESVGGAEQAALIVLASLDRRYWRLVLFHHPEPGLSPLLGRARRLGIEPRCLPRLRGRRRVSAMLRFAGALRAERTAIFHSHLTWSLGGKAGLASAMLARTPAIVATQHLLTGADRPLAKLLQRLTSNGVARYIAVSEQVASGLQHDLHVPRSKIRVVRNGIDPSIFRKRPGCNGPEVRRELASGAGPVVLTVARLNRQKGLSYLLQAARMIPGAEFAVVGDGPERAMLETQARSLGLQHRVRFLGHREDVPGLMAACDLFVLPSLNEGLPLVILEAMASGKPVVATAVGGTPEVVTHQQTGLLVPPADPASLAQAIQELLANPGLGERLVSAAIARVREEFTADMVARKTTEIYEEALQHRGAIHLA